MQDQGEFAERHRRLAIAGLTAAMIFIPSFHEQQDTELGRILLNTRMFLLELRKSKNFWPHGTPPEIENFTEFEIDKDGNVINFTGKMVRMD